MRSIFAFIVLFATSFGTLALEFKTVPLSDAFLPSQYQPSKENTLPFLFTIPSNFEKRDVPRQETVAWGTKEDLDTVISSGNPAKAKNGIFTLKISLNVGYDPQTKKFSGEDQMANMKNQPGVSDVVFQRTDIHGFPMATLSAVINDRHVFLHYVALDSATLMITYFHPETFSPKDSEVWSRFLNGLKENK